MGYVSRMVDLVESICASSELSTTEKSDALEEVIVGVLCQGEIEGSEFGDSSAMFHPLRPTSEEKDKTIVIEREQLMSAQRLNKIIGRTRIQWDGSNVGEKEVKFIQDELDRRGIKVPE